MSTCPEAQRLADQILGWLSEEEDIHERENGLDSAEDAMTRTIIIREIIEDAGYIDTEAVRRKEAQAKALYPKRRKCRHRPVRRFVQFVKRHPLY